MVTSTTDRGGYTTTPKVIRVIASGLLGSRRVRLVESADGAACWWELLDSDGQVEQLGLGTRGLA